MLPRLLPIVLLLFASLCRLAADEAYDYRTLRHEVPSPHWRFGRPLARRLRVAVLAPVMAQRESVELAQRLDCEVVPLMVHRGDMLGTPDGARGTLPQHEALRLLQEGLKGEFDVLVIGRVEWGVLGEEINREIIERTRAGMGLVYICPPGKRLSVDHPLFQPQPLPLAEFGATGCAGLPGFEAVADNGAFLRQSLQAYALGTGRLLVVDYGEAAPSAHHYLTPPTRRWRDGFSHYDLYLAFLAKAIRWTASASPPLLLAGIEVPAKVVWGEPARVHLRIEGELPDRLRAELTIRRLRPSLWDPAATLHPIVETGEGGLVEIELPTTHLPMGEYEAMVVLRDAAHVLDWGSGRFHLEPPVAIEELSIPDRALPKTAASLPVTLRLGGQVERAATARLDIHDRHGRLAGRRETPYPAAGLRTDVSCAFSRSNYNRLTVSVLDAAGLPLLCQAVEFTIPRPPESGTYFFVMAGDGDDDYIGSLLRREAAAAGADAALVPLGPAQPRPLTEAEQAEVKERLMALARAGIAPVAAVFGEAGEGNRPNLADPALREAVAAALDERLALLRPFAPLGVVLEPETEAPVQSPEFPVPADWVVRQQDQDRNLAEAREFFPEAVRRLLPDTWAGLAGVVGDLPAQSWDWMALGRANRLVCLRPEARGALSLLRSFQPPDAIRGVWFGGYGDRRADLARQRWMPWKLFFEGGNSAWFHAAYSPVGGHGEIGFRPDLVPYGCWQMASGEINRLQAGIGRLLLAADVDDGAVALVYSRPSALVSGLDSSYDGHLAAFSGMARLLGDAGIPFRVIPAADLADGGALWSRHRAVLLPACVALADAAVQGLQDFAASGGLVLADWGTGRYDEAGKQREAGPLDGLFGIQPGAARGTFPPPDGIPGLLARTRVDGNVLLRRSWPGLLAEGVPVLIHADYGKGLAVYLNFSLADYPYQIGGGLPEWLRRTLAREGIPEPVPVRGTLIETHRWRRGEASVIGLLKHPRTPPPGETVELALPADRYAYDLLAGRYLGKGGSASFTLAPGEAKLVSFEPERISKVDFDRLKGVEFTSPAYRITVRSGLKAAAGRFVHFRLFDPAGALYPPGTMTLAAADGTCEYDVPFGLVPPAPGRWRLEATDVATGLRGKTTFTISPRD